MAVYVGSRYTKTPLYLLDGYPVLGIRKRNNFNKATAYFHTVVLGEDVNLISYKYYGSASYYWAIMDANPQYKNELEIKEGDVIHIPSVDEVVKAIE
jgi:nucleoid-associated protein YgaU